MMSNTTYQIKDSKAAQRRVDSLTKNGVEYDLSTNEGRKTFGYMYLSSYTPLTVLSQAQGPNRAQRRQSKRNNND